MMKRKATGQGKCSLCGMTNTCVSVRLGNDGDLLCCVQATPGAPGSSAPANETAAERIARARQYLNKKDSPAPPLSPASAPAPPAALAPAPAASTLQQTQAQERRMARFASPEGADQRDSVEKDADYMQVRWTSILCILISLSHYPARAAHLFIFLCALEPT